MWRILQILVEFNRFWNKFWNRFSSLQRILAGKKFLVWFDIRAPFLTFCVTGAIFIICKDTAHLCALFNLSRIWVITKRPPKFLWVRGTFSISATFCKYIFHHEQQIFCHEPLLLTVDGISNRNNRLSFHLWVEWSQCGKRKCSKYVETVFPYPARFHENRWEWGIQYSRFHMQWPIYRMLQIFCSKLHLLMENTRINIFSYIKKLKKVLLTRYLLQNFLRHWATFLQLFYSRLIPQIWHTYKTSKENHYSFLRIILHS